ncbi:hypothetical protein ASG01_07445 [Chryseobacterium sp. Leaf180]|nr:hypothetical protein ASG01_07445 [Chryseobacterium sp. Leaf180]
MFTVISTAFKSQLIHHTTNYFGPNANPVPEFTGAAIPKETQLEIMGDYYFGFGDQTISNFVRAEIPLVPEKVSVKFWKTTIENYSVTDEIVQRRAMQKNKGVATGDFYMQTRIKVLSENEKRPAIVVNATLKTASGNAFDNRRFFDTAGYYFDVEVGKSFQLENAFLDEIRFSTDLGFFSWDVQTPNLNVQDDALMYGFKLMLRHKNIRWENTVSGYNGWIRRVEDYGDQPLVYASKLSFDLHKIQIFGQFQYGIRYFPYNQIRIGVQIPLNKLTPNFFSDKE